MNDTRFKINRKRTRHFQTARERQRRNLNQIKKLLEDVGIYLNSIGLEFSNKIFHIKESEENFRIRRDENEIIRDHEKNEINLNYKLVFYQNNQPTNQKTIKYQEVETDNKICYDMSVQYEEQNKNKITYDLLKAKDQMSLSDLKFKTLKDLFNNQLKQNISIYSVQMIKKEMDNKFEIKKINLRNNKIGCFINPRQKIEFFIEKFIEKYKLTRKSKDIKIRKSNFIENNTIIIKFSGTYFCI
jgi:hypothetical protein